MYDYHDNRSGFFKRMSLTKERKKNIFKIGNSPCKYVKNVYIYNAVGQMMKYCSSIFRQNCIDLLNAHNFSGERYRMGIAKKKLLLIFDHQMYLY